MRLLLAALLLFGGVSATNYELESHWDGVLASDVQGIEKDRSAYLPYETQISQRLSEILNGQIEGFFIDYFEVHGASEGIPSAIFHGYFTSELSRDEILNLIKSTQDTAFFRLGPVAVVPEAPSASEFKTEDFTSCKNGGYMLKNLTCVCPNYYSGSSCEVVSCLHHGILDGQRCACAPGVYGINCESRGCSPQVENTVDFSTESFVLVLNTRDSMAYGINTVIGQIQTFLSDIDAQSGKQLYSNYIVVSYVLYGPESKLVYYMQPQAFTDRDSFIQYLYTISIVTSSLDQPTTRAILLAQTFYAQMKAYSNMLVFADSGDYDAQPVSYKYSTNSSEFHLAEKTIAWRNKIIMVLLQTDNNMIDTFGNQYDTYRRLVREVHGDLIIVDDAELTNVLDRVLVYFWQMENIAVRYQADASAGFSVPINADHDQQFFYTLITVEPNGTLPTFQDDKGTAVTPESSGKRWAIIRSIPAALSGLKITGSGSTTVRVFVNSDKTVIMAFASDPNTDVGQSSNIAQIATFGSFFIANFQQIGSITHSVLDDTTGAVISAPITASLRTSQCSFPWSFPSRPSCTPGPYCQSIQVMSAGVTVNRVLPGLCGSLDIVEPPPFSCLHGGTRTGTRSCRCATGWQGTNCGDPQCLNGGTIEQFPGNGRPLCQCPTGYGGDRCDQLSCTTMNQKNFDYSNRTLALVLQSSMSQAGVNSKIINGLTVLLNLMSGSDAFTNYLLTNFNTVYKSGGNAPVVNTATFTDRGAFISAATAGNLSYTASSETTQPSMTALFTTLASTSYARSSVFMFVDAPANDMNQLNNVMEWAITMQQEVSVIVTPPFGKMELCMNSTFLDAYVNLAYRTGGQILNLCQPYTGTYTTDPIVMFFLAYGSTHHHTENLVEGNVLDCSTPTNLTYYVDSYNDNIFVYVNSDTLESFQVTIWNNDQGSGQTLNSAYALPFLGIYIPSSAFGNINGYTLQFSSKTAGRCSCRVAEKTFVGVAFGFSSDPSVDYGSSELQFAQESHPVAHISSVNLPSSPDISVAAIDDVGVASYTSKSVVRQQTCEFEEFFTAPFTCSNVHQDFKMLISVDLGQGKGKLQRTQRAYCYIKNGQCLNGGTFGSGGCSCGSQFTGDYCETPRCFNGGTAISYKCVCTAGFTGQNCQNAICHQWNYLESEDSRVQNFNQIIFAVEKSTRSILVMNFLKSNIAKFVAQSETTQTPKQYSLITFDDTQVVDVVSSAHSDVFINGFNAALSANPSTLSKQPTSVMAIDSVIEAYATAIQSPAIVYLFLTSNSSTVATLQALKARQGLQVNVIYTPVGATFPGQPTGYQIPLLVRPSMGRILPMGAYSISTSNNWLASMITENGFVYDNANQDCSTGASFSFNIESVASSVVITVTGASVYGKVQVTDGSNATVDLTSAYLSTDSSAVILKIPTTSGQAGNWNLMVTSGDGSCFVQVRVVSPLHVLPGFTSDRNSDFVKSIPFTGLSSATYRGGKQSSIVFRLTDPVNAKDQATLQSAIIYESADFSKPWATSTPSVVTLSPRDPNNCAYQYVTPDGFQFGSGNYKKMVVIGKDQNGVEFTRTFFYSLPRSTDKASMCVFGTINAYDECICDSNHQGDLCSDPICQNGGSSSYGVCVCNGGYYGDFCEKYTGSISFETTQAINTATFGPPSSMGTATPAASTKVTTANAASTSASAATSATTPTTMKTTVVTTTAAPRACDPVSTTYFLNFMLDATGISVDLAFVGNAGNELMQSVGSKLQLGSGLSSTRLVIAGMTGGYIFSSADDRVSTIAGITPATTSISNAVTYPNTTLDIVTSVSQMLQNVDASAYTGNESPPISVIVATREWVGDEGTLTSALGNLRNKGYKVMAVDASGDGTLMEYFTPVLGDNSFKMTNADDAAQWIIGRACLFKPT